MHRLIIFDMLFWIIMKRSWPNRELPFPFGALQSSCIWICFVLAGKITMFPLVGSMLGATQVLISGPCFNATSLIVCDFDGIETFGRLLSVKTALCVSPTFYKVGRIPLRVSLDGGRTFLFKGTFTISKLESVIFVSTFNVFIWL